mmetsp:Transcript_12278/g.28937  ORF Transcript_12278/g.28937 Transcript_12278/m.28937 type:complete len:228 (-) Transcript_12278:1356-2039(-)
MTDIRHARGHQPLRLLLRPLSCTPPPDSEATPQPVQPPSRGAASGCDVECCLLGRLVEHGEGRELGVEAEVVEAREARVPVVGLDLHPHAVHLLHRPVLRRNDREALDVRVEAGGGYAVLPLHQRLRLQVAAQPPLDCELARRGAAALDGESGRRVLDHEAGGLYRPVQPHFHEPPRAAHGPAMPQLRPLLAHLAPLRRIRLDDGLSRELERLVDRLLGVTHHGRHA